MCKFEPLLARMEITDDELQDLYVWVDDIELSRPKRNIARDFADGGSLSWTKGKCQALYS